MCAIEDCSYRCVLWTAGKYEYLHRVITNYPDSNFYLVDHEDRDTTNNTKDNLRICPHRFNAVNRGKQRNGVTSKYIGVSFYKRDSNWEVKVGKDFYGRFSTEREAALKYNEGAKRKYGEFAPQNIVD